MANGNNLSISISVVEDAVKNIAAFRKNLEKLLNTKVEAHIGVSKESLNELKLINEKLVSIFNVISKMGKETVKVEVDTKNVQAGETEIKALTEAIGQLRTALDGMGKGSKATGVDDSQIQKYENFSKAISDLSKSLSELAPILRGTNFKDLADGLSEASRQMALLSSNIANIGTNLSINLSQGVIGELNKITDAAKATGKALDEVDQKKQSNASQNFTKDFSIADALGKMKAYERMLREADQLIAKSNDRGIDTSRLEDYRNRIVEIIRALKELKDNGGLLSKGMFKDMTTRQFLSGTESNAKELRELRKEYKDAERVRTNRDKSIDSARTKLHELGEQMRKITALQADMQRLRLDTTQIDAAIAKLAQLLLDLNKIRTTGAVNGMSYSEYMGQSSTKNTLYDTAEARRKATQAVNEEEKRRADIQEQSRRAAEKRQREEEQADRKRLSSLDKIANKLTSLATLEQKIRNSGALTSNTAAADGVKQQYAAVQNLIAAYQQLKTVIEGLTGKQFTSGNYGDQMKGLNHQLALLKQNSGDALGAFRREQSAAGHSTSQLTTRQQVLTNAMQQANQAARGQSQILTDLKSMAAQYVSVWGAMNFVKQVAQVTGELELQRKSLEVIIGNASYARGLYADIRDLSQQSPYNFQDLMKSTRQLAAFGVQTKDLYATMKSLSDIGAGLSVDVSRLILAYGHTKSYGYLSGIQNRQFETAGIDMVGGLADHYNKLAKAAAGAGEQIQRVSRQDVFKMIREKAVSFEDVNAVIMGLDKPGGKFYNMQERQYDTIGGKLRNLRNNYNIMLSEIGESHKGILKWGVDGLNELTGHWEKYANILSMVLVPMGALKLANMALTSSLTRQSRQIVTNMREWGRQTRLGDRLANYLGGVGNGQTHGNKWIPTRAERITFADNLRDKMRKTELTRKDAIRLGFSRSLPKDLRNIALALGGVDQATRKTILSGNLFQRTWMRIKLSLFNFGDVLRSVGRAIRSLVVSVGQLAPMMAIMAAFQHISKVKSDAESVAESFRETGNNDRKELADLMQRYIDQIGDVNNDNVSDVSITKNWSNNRRYNTLNVNKDALRSMGVDLTDEIREIKEKMQAMDPLVDVNLFDINKMTDQYDQFESLLQRAETLRRVNEAKEASAPLLEQAIEESAGGKHWYNQMWGDTVVTNMQEAVDEYNNMLKEIGALTEEDILKINEDWDGFLQKKADTEGYETLRDALQALAREFSVTTEGADKLEKAIRATTNPKQIYGGKSADFFDWLKDGRVQMKQAEKDIVKFGKEIAALTRSQNFKKDIYVEGADGSKTLKTVVDTDAAALYIEEVIKGLQERLKGNGEETGYHFATGFIESTLENLKNFGFSDGDIQAIADQLNMNRILPMIKQMAGEQRIDMDKVYTEEEINKLAEDMKTYMIGKGGEFQEVGEKYAEFILKGLQIILKTGGGEADKVLDDWQKDLIRQIEGDELGVEVTTKVKNKLVKDIKDSDDLKKFWQETFKKKFDAAKSYIESQNLLIQNTVKWNIGTDLNFGDTKQLTDLLKTLRGYRSQADSSNLKAAKDQIPYLDGLIGTLETYLAMVALADKNNQSFGKTQRDKYQQDQQKRLEKQRQEAERIKREQEQKAREAKQKAEREAREAEQKEHERQRKLLDDYRERIRVIKDARSEYKKLIDDGFAEADALKTIKGSFQIWFDHGILKKGDLDDLEHYEQAIDNIVNLARQLRGSQFEDIKKAVGNIEEDAIKLKNELDRIKFKDMKDNFLAKVEKDLVDIQRAWKMFDDVLSKTGDYGLATKFAAREISNPLQKNDMRASRMSELLWDYIRKTGLEVGMKIGSFGGFNIRDNLFSKNVAYNMTDKELDEYVRKVMHAQLESISNTERRKQATEELSSMTEGLVKLLKEWRKSLQDEKDATKLRAAEILGSATYLDTQRAKIEKDYAETIRSLRLKKENGEYYIPEESEKAAEQAKAKRDYELFLLSEKYQRYMNSIETLTVDEVRNTAQYIRAQLSEAFRKGIIDANTYTEKNKEVNDLLEKNLPYRFPFMSNGRKPIYEQVGRWFFDPTEENNKNALQGWRGDVGRRLDAQYGKKAEEQDENLINALEILAFLLDKILNGTATKKDMKIAGDLGGLVAGWGSVSESTKDRILHEAKANDEENAERNQGGDTDKKVRHFKDVVDDIVKALTALKEGLDFFRDFFDSLGMEGAANAVGDASTVVGGALNGASAMGGMMGQLGQIAPALGKLGPYGAAAGAAIGLVSGIAQAGDAKRQRQIEALRRDVQQIDNTLNLIKNLREKTLGYDTGQRRRELAQRYANQGKWITLPAMLGMKSQTVFTGSASSEAMYDYYMRGGVDGNGYSQELNALKKQREDYLEMYDKENGKKKKSKEDLEEYRNKVAELDIQIMEYTSNLAKELWSIDLTGWASQIGDALMTAFENGTNAAAAFRDSVQDIMRSVVKSMMVKGIIEPMFEKLQDKLFGENGKFDIENPQATMRTTLAALSDFFKNDANKMITSAQEFYEGANNIMEQSLGYGLDAKDSSKNMADSITSTASEETMGIVAGYLSALRQDVGVNRIMLTGFMNESWPSYIDMVTTANQSLTAVDRNTEQIMIMMRDGQGALYERVERMSRRLDNFANGIDRLHTA